MYSNEQYFGIRSILFEAGYATIKLRKNLSIPLGLAVSIEATGFAALDGNTIKNVESTVSGKLKVPVNGNTQGTHYNAGYVKIAPFARAGASVCRRTKTSPGCLRSSLRQTYANIRAIKDATIFNNEFIVLPDLEGAWEYYESGDTLPESPPVEGFYMQVSDHGNVTLYRWSGDDHTGTNDWTEVWSIV